MNFPGKMEESIKSSKISLKSSKKLTYCNVFTLLVPNFFILPDYKDNIFNVDSPSFELYNATWCFRCYSTEKSRNTFSIYIIRLKTETPYHLQKFCYKITLLDHHGMKYSDHSDICNLNESNDCAFLKKFFKIYNYFDGSDNLTLVIHLFRFETAEVNIKQIICTTNFQEKKEETMKMAASKIILESSAKAIFCDVYELLVPNIFFLPGYNVFEEDSPSFELDNATWCFRCYLTEGSNNRLNINIRRLKTEISEHSFWYKSTLLDDGGMRHSDLSDVCTINKSSDCADLGFYLKILSSHLKCNTLTLVIQLLDFETTEIQFKQPSCIKVKEAAVHSDIVKKTEGLNSSGLGFGTQNSTGYTFGALGFVSGSAVTIPSTITGFSFGMPAASTASTNVAFGATKFSTASANTGLAFGGTVTTPSTTITGVTFSIPSASTTGTNIAFGVPKTSSANSGFAFGAAVTTPSTTITGETFNMPAPSTPGTKFAFGTTKISTAPANPGFAFGAAVTTLSHTGLTFNMPTASTPGTKFAFRTPKTLTAPANSGFAFGAAVTTPSHTGLTFNMPAASTAVNTSITFGTPTTVASIGHCLFGQVTTTGFTFGSQTQATTTDFSFRTTPSKQTSVSSFSTSKSNSTVSTSQPSSATLDLNLLSRDFKELFLNGVDCDLTLKVTGKEFQVHRAILRARSQVFQAMLSHDMIEKTKGIIDIPDIDAEVIELVLIYLYSGEVGSLNHDNVFGAYYAADKYNLSSLKNKCAEFMKTSLTTSIICDVIQLALNHNDRGLLECCTEYFIKHVSNILPTVEWMTFLQSNPITANELYIKANKKGMRT